MVAPLPTRRRFLLAPVAAAAFPWAALAEPVASTVLRLPPAEPIRLFSLDDPPRIVIDAPLPWPAADARGAVGLVAGLRQGLAQPGVARLVIDLAAPARAIAARAGDALVVTLTPLSAAAFAASAGWPEGARVSVPAAPLPLAVIDPGHGGRDPGAVVAGLREKDITLATAHALAPVLEAAGFRVLLTRRDDRFVSLGARVALAREAGATVLLSLHADTVTEGDAAGASVYLLAAEASDPQTAALAARANVDAGPGVGERAGEGRDVAAVLAALAMRETQRHAGALGPALIDALAARVPVLSGNPLRAAAFHVLKAPDVPSALVELGFLSNAQDRARLVDPAWRADAVAALAAGLADWYEQVRGVVCAQQPCHRRD